MGPKDEEPRDAEMAPGGSAAFFSKSPVEARSKSKALPSGRSDEISENRTLMYSDSSGGIRALLDPITYFNHLSHVQSEVENLCHVREVVREIVGTGSNDYHFHLNVLRTIKRAIGLMRDEGMSSNTTILVRDSSWSSTIRTITIKPDGLRDLITAVEAFVLRRPANQYAMMTLRALVDKFDGASLFDGAPFLGSDTTLQGLIAILALGTASYAGSHCSDIAGLDSGWSAELPPESIASANNDMPRRHFYLERQRLGCLGEYVGGPVWVLGPTALTDEAQLSITVDQLADLWGPISVVRSTTSPDAIVAIQTDGGLITRKSPRSSGIKGGSSIDDNEVTLHWERLSSLQAQEMLAGELAEFSPYSQLLIGVHNEHTTTVSEPTVSESLRYRCRTAASQQHTLTDQQNSALVTNTDCPLTKDDLIHKHGFHLKTVGTSEPHLERDALQVSISGGYYVSVGLQKVWKWRPGTTYKARLLNELRNSNLHRDDVKALLEQRVGLEMSACTKNAQRLSLGEVLKLAYPDDLGRVDDACANGDAKELAALLEYLETTGVHDDHDMLLYWPYSKGLGEALSLKDMIGEKQLPYWTPILKDTHISACFAVVTLRCSTMTRRKGGIQYALPCQPESFIFGLPNQYVLYTRLELDPSDTLRPPLRKGSRLKLHEGALEILTEDAVAPLAYLRPNSITTKFGRATIPRQRELIFVHRASPYLVDVCIAKFRSDPPARRLI